MSQPNPPIIHSPSWGGFPRGREISFGEKKSSQKPQTKRDPPSSSRERRGDERRLADSSVMPSSFFLSLSFFSLSLLLSLHRPPFRARPFSSFYCSSRRRQTVANRIRGPLFTRSPATLCLLLTNFGRSSSLSSFSLYFSLPPAASPSPLINGILATYNSLSSDRDHVLIAAAAANGTISEVDLNVIYHLLMLIIEKERDVSFCYWRKKKDSRSIINFLV